MLPTATTAIDLTSYGDYGEVTADFIDYRNYNGVTAVTPKLRRSIAIAPRKMTRRRRQPIVTRYLDVLISFRVAFDYVWCCNKS